MLDPIVILKDGGFYLYAIGVLTLVALPFALSLGFLHRTRNVPAAIVLLPIAGIGLLSLLDVWAVARMAEYVVIHAEDMRWIHASIVSFDVMLYSLAGMMIGTTAALSLALGSLLSGTKAPGPAPTGSPGPLGAGPFAPSFAATENHRETFRWTPIHAVAPSLIALAGAVLFAIGSYNALGMICGTGLVAIALSSLRAGTSDDGVARDARGRVLVGACVAMVAAATTSLGAAYQFTMTISAWAKSSADAKPELLLASMDEMAIWPGSLAVVALLFAGLVAVVPVRSGLADGAVWRVLGLGVFIAGVGSFMWIPVVLVELLQIMAEL